MRTLVIGAGALGGYYGACLTRAGRDVTFLVRPGRTEQLARNGLRIVGPTDDFTISPNTVLAQDLRNTFDLILVGTKSYSLPEAMDQFAPAVGPATAILPILNGMAHLDTLATRFGAHHVLGGMALIGAALDTNGHVVCNWSKELVFGEVAGGFSDRTRALSTLFEGSGFEARTSEVVLQDMWEKWSGLATLAGMTCLMRSNLGVILGVPGGQDACLRLFAECCAVAVASGFAPRPAYIEFAKAIFATPGSPIKPSMLHDIERGSVTEGEHVLGDLADRARALGIATPILDLARIHLAAYEAQLGSAQ